MSGDGACHELAEWWRPGASEEAKSESDNGGFSYRNRNSAMTKWLS
jgi:hypothetical protein